MLKPREERDVTASQVIDRLRPQLAKIVGVNLFLQPAQDITVGGRISRAAFQYTLQDPNVAELNEWSKKLLDKMRTLPQLTDVASDLLAEAPQLKVTINRDLAARFGISPQAIDDTLNDAYGQRQITQYFTQLNTYWVILEIPPELQHNRASLDRIYVKSPAHGRRGAVIHARRHGLSENWAAIRQSSTPISRSDIVIQFARRRCAGRGSRRDQQGGAGNRCAQLRDRNVPG